MANQTITVDKTISQVIADGLSDGENITINSGAALTVDESPTVLVGQVTINEGEMVLDGENATNPIVFVGENAEEINVNGAGVFRSTLGWWIHPTASTGAANQTWDVSAYFSPSEVDADVFSGCWVETGRRINYDGGSGVAPEVGDWLFKYDSGNPQDNGVHGRITEVSGDGVTGYVVVRFLTGSIADNDTIELHTIQDNAGDDYQISWAASADGADVLEADVWQEFGNARQNAANGLSAIGSGMAGFGFEQSHGSNTLTFGDGVNGFIPPNGARIKFPMCHIATANLADYASNTTTYQAGAASRYELELVNGGDCYLDGLSIGSAQFDDNLGGQFQASYCAVNTGFGTYGAIGRATYDHCIFVGDIEDDERSQARSVPAVVDMVAGADIRDCLGLFTNDAAETTQLGGQTSLNVNIERCIQVSNATAIEWEMVRVNDFTINDMVVIGSQMVFTTCLGGTARLLKFQRDILDASSIASDQLIFNAATSDVKVTGIEVLNNNAPDDSKVVVTDCNNIQVRGFHFIDRKYDNEATAHTQQEEFVAIGGLNNEILFARCWTDRGNPNEFALIASGTSKNVTIQNCSSEYTGEIEPDGINTLVRGLHSGSGSLGSGTGVETDLIGTAGAPCGDAFRSDTQGILFYNNVPESAEYPYTILSGSPIFTKDGDVDISIGDSWEVDSGYFAKGHTGFNGTIASVRADQTTNTVWNWTAYCDVELQYDDGSGYNGTWIDVTDAAAMGNIVFNVAGMRFKYRFTATANQTDLQGFTLRTTTALQDQIDNYYPLDQRTLTITGIENPSKVYLFNSALDETDPDYQLSSQLVTNGEFTYGFNGGAGITAIYRVVSLDFIVLEDEIFLEDKDITLPVNQSVDRGYANN